VLTTLLEAGTHDIESRGQHNFTPLISAARHGSVECVHALLAAGADVEAADLHGSTALHRASYFGTKKVIAALVELGASLEATDRFGRTPLHVAADNGAVDACRLLLKLGSSTNARDGPMRDGDTPLAVARAAGQEATANLLQARDMRTIRLAAGATKMVGPDYVHVPFR